MPWRWSRRPTRGSGSTQGAAHRRWLHLRGLKKATIFEASLGCTTGVTVPTHGDLRFFRASGIVIPWFDGDRLTMVKIRQPDGKSPKYIDVFRNGPVAYPSLGIVRPGAPLILTEGEFDALLLGQELGDRAAVLTLGSASNRPAPGVLSAIAEAAPIFAAHDADPAGDRAALAWAGRAQRVRLAAPDKDWTDAHRRGAGHIRFLWQEILPEPNDDHDRQERAAIIEFDAGLSRAVAERAAGIRTETVGVEEAS